MLLDYRAVGVELVIPPIELRNFKDWASVLWKTHKKVGSNVYGDHFSPKGNYQKGNILPGVNSLMKELANEQRKATSQTRTKKFTTNKAITNVYVDLKTKTQGELSNFDR